MLEFDCIHLSGLEKVRLKKQTVLLVYCGSNSEKFLLDEAAIDGLLAQFNVP